MRGAGVEAVRRKEAACGRHTAMTVHHARPAVRDRVSNVSSSLAAKTARKREIGESDFGSGGERTCRARYPSWIVTFISVQMLLPTIGSTAPSTISGCAANFPAKEQGGCTVVLGSDAPYSDSSPQRWWPPVFNQGWKAPSS
ncbi:hypothetical protein HPB50_007304 [Hyalomma asiaticum]|uniref:Uncharacterized protein n=1 Tax=Hyalomma asiaticum TaxID=266040 RepID=A0ACB7SIQ1_HYAAI|nr:hypothetical protein HPB50_007304 [Hyalomma asiaticum]